MVCGDCHVRYGGMSVLSPSDDRPTRTAQLRPSRIAGFQSALDRITADLAAHGPGADALARAKATQIAGLERAQASDNGYWLAQLSDNLADPVSRLEPTAYKPFPPELVAKALASMPPAVAAFLTPVPLKPLHP